MEPVTFSEAVQQLARTRFDWDMIEPVISEMMEYTGKFDTWDALCGPHFPPFLGRDELRENMGRAVGDFMEIGNTPRQFRGESTRTV